MLRGVEEGIFLVELQELEDLYGLERWTGLEIDGAKNGCPSFGFPIALTAVDRKRGRRRLWRNSLQTRRLVHQRQKNKEILHSRKFCSRDFLLISRACCSGPALSRGNDSRGSNGKVSRHHGDHKVER